MTVRAAALVLLGNTGMPGSGGQPKGARGSDDALNLAEERWIKERKGVRKVKG